MAAAGAQHLFRRPQGVTTAGSAHDSELREIQAARSQSRRIRQVRRREPDDALAGPR